MEAEEAPVSRQVAIECVCPECGRAGMKYITVVTSAGSDSHTQCYCGYRSLSNFSAARPGFAAFSTSALPSGISDKSWNEKDTTP